MNYEMLRSNRRQPVPGGKVIDLTAQSSTFHLPRILVLDDDADFCSLLKDFLESVPYHVTAVTNGMEGLQQILVADFDSIVCDMKMPKLAGDLFYLAVERAKPELCARFIFMTGHVANPKIDYFIKEIGGTMLAKPFHMADLRAAISYVLKDVELRKAYKNRHRRPGSRHPRE